MQSCQFAKNIIERGSGKFSAFRLDAVLFEGCSTVAAGRFSVVRVYECGFPGARKFCCATCSTFALHFYAKETWRIPLFCLFRTFILRQLWMVLAVYITRYSWGELLFILFCFGGSAFCVSPVFVRSRGVRICYYFRGKACFMFIRFRVNFLPPLPVGRGAYSLANLPLSIQNDVSFGI